MGEFAIEDDIAVGMPFMGKPGNELTMMLREAGLSRSEVAMSYVFPFTLVKDNTDSICVSKRQADEEWKEVGFEGKYGVPMLKQGKYVKPSVLMAIPALAQWLSEVKPNLVVAMGPVACWALLGTGSVRKLRGTVAESILVPGLKVLPTYSPHGVYKMWDLRPIVVADLQKAARECVTPHIKRPSRKIWLEPTLDDLYAFRDQYMPRWSTIGTDIETAHRQATCIGFAPSPEIALVIPFVDERKPGNNYWPTQEQEVEAWRFVNDILGGEYIKLFQNGLYDIQYLWRVHRCKLRYCEEDTMLLHHSLQPELEKGLGFLGSLYTNEPAWKLMNSKSKKEELKRDE